MIRPRQIIHLLRINRVLVRHGLDSLIYRTHFFRFFRFFLYLLPWYWFRNRTAPLGSRIREALIELGPIFVKFGQILSTRRDLLPDDIAIELSLLQDRVPPFPGAEAQQLIESAFGQPVDELFDDFSVEPLASASIAQVHAATLKTGESVVIKVLRPGIEPVIRRDLELMYYLAELAQRFWRDGRRLRPVEVVTEFDKVIHDELDLVREAANAAQLRRNFIDNDLLYVPDVHWDLVRRNVLVMERIHGTPVSQVDKLRASGIDIKRLAEDGVEIFYTQVFSHNFFHADMHPGNIFVSDDGHYIAVDFGIMGTLTEEDQRYLAENFIAFFNRDYHRVAELHVQSGWVPPGTRIDEFEAAIRSVCEPNFNKPLKDISFGQVLMRLFETARRFDMEVQPQLVLLQKTLLNIEGLGRQLYPDLDLWQTAKPFLERWMREQMSVKRLLKRLARDFPLILERLPEMPDLVYQHLKQNLSQRPDATNESRELELLRKELATTRKSGLRAIIGGTSVVVATVLFVLPQTATTLHYTLGTAFAAAGSLLVWLSIRN